jgi:hypothetical protein
MVISLPAPYDVQVASGWPAVNAYRSQLVRVRELRGALARAEHYRDAVLDTYLTTTARGREGRALAVEGVEEAVRALAVAEDLLPAYAAAAAFVAPAATARVRLSMESLRARWLAEREWYDDRH